MDVFGLGLSDSQYGSPNINSQKASDDFMEKIDISLGEADEASIKVDKIQTAFSPDDGPQPEKENPTIWRYRTFGELAELLTSEKLWFSHVSNFDDPYEAILVNSTTPELSLLDIFSDEDQRFSNETFSRTRTYAMSHANCWHINEGESAALWNQYGGDQNAVAIKSTSKRLRDELESKPYWMAFGKVKYGLNGDVENSVFRKREDFKYEKEYRAVVYDYSRFASIMRDWERVKEEYKKYNGFHMEPSIIDLMSEGEAIEINLDNLIEEVYVDPTANERFVKAVRSVVSEFVDCPVKSSSLFDDPLSEAGR